MDIASGKFEMCGTMIGGEIDNNTPVRKHVGKCLGRKQMTAGAAGRKQDERRAARSHQMPLPATASSGVTMAARGCSRVNAKSMPIA